MSQIGEDTEQILITQQNYSFPPYSLRTCTNGYLTRTIYWSINDPTTMSI